MRIQENCKFRKVKIDPGHYFLFFFALGTLAGGFTAVLELHWLPEIFKTTKLKYIYF